MGHRHDVIIPKKMLIAAGFLMAFSILIAGLSARGIVEFEAPYTTKVIRAVDLSFRDKSEGGIDVIEVSSGTVLDTYEPGTNGFARGVVRSLVRERQAHGIGNAEPFRLELIASNRLVLADLTTGRRIELTPFGPDNVEVFVKLLKAGGAS